MPSPFPGMDPYLEAPYIWPDFHHAFAVEISHELNRALPAPYYARLEMRQEVGIVDDDNAPPRRIVPDVAIVRRPRSGSEGGTSLAEQVRREVSESYDVTIELDPFRHHFVEIRYPSRGHKLVTLIEILSPSNKQIGPDRADYTRMQGEILESDASLVEIDLLRDGCRIVPHVGLEPFLLGLRPKPTYLVFVNTPWSRGEWGLGYQVYPFGLRECLPCVGIPLKAGESVVPLDLQFVFDSVYDGGPYRRGEVDYAKPPEPPVSDDDLAWIKATLHSYIHPLADETGKT